jgi:hypothetical protein
MPALTRAGDNLCDATDLAIQSYSNDFLKHTSCFDNNELYGRLKNSLTFLLSAVEGRR